MLSTGHMVLLRRASAIQIQHSHYMWLRHSFQLEFTHRVRHSLKHLISLQATQTSWESEKDLINYALGFHLLPNSQKVCVCDVWACRSTPNPETMQSHHGTLQQSDLIESSDMVRQYSRFIQFQTNHSGVIHFWVNIGTGGRGRGEINQLL